MPNSGVHTGSCACTTCLKRRYYRQYAPDSRNGTPGPGDILWSRSPPPALMPMRTQHFVRTLQHHRHVTYFGPILSQVIHQVTVVRLVQPSLTHL